MEKKEFSQGWKIAKAGSAGAYKDISVPYDAMIFEKRDETSKGGKNIGFFVASDYEFLKEFTICDSDPKKNRWLEFEGVYRNSEVSLNGEVISDNRYGYTDFFLDITSKVKPGLNTLKVLARNADQPNSRWYSGTGILRPVWLYEGPSEHLLPNGICIKTLEADKRLLEVRFLLQGEGEISYSVCGQDGKELLKKSVMSENGEAVDLFSLPEAQLWSPDNPCIYELKADFKGDKAEASFGIRTISLDLKKGLLLNGETIHLHGCCIHSDNGLLGAIDHPYASYLKVKAMKSLGYNAVRSAHNPLSKSMLEECDKQGMLVLDEYADCWITHKTKYDYALQLKDSYEQDLKEMADKDFNHPSVIMYSLGNEVGESSTKPGIAICAEMAKAMRKYDPTRPLTVGVNIFFNLLYARGFGVYSDKKSDKEAKQAGHAKKKAVGSEFFNNLAGLLGANFMKTCACLKGCDLKTRGVFKLLDAAGYNYGIKRYKHDLKEYPNRFIIGTETFCKDLRKYLTLEKDNPRLLGDFVWAGVDYLGECGIGSIVYEEYCKIESGQMGWMTAGSGRLDITLRGNGEAEYTKTMYGMKKIGLAAIPANLYGYKHSPSSWKMTPAEPSWSFQGAEGRKTLVEVYSLCPQVELFLNDKSLGIKKTDEDGVAYYKVKYEPGVLKAVNVGEEGETSLKTCADDYKLICRGPEKLKLGELAYIRLRFADADNTACYTAHDKITVQEVTNGELLGLGSGNPYEPDSYKDNVTDSYFGAALAIVKPTKKGEITLKCTSEKYGTAVYKGTVE